MLPYPLDISIKAKNYKCFADEPQGFESIHPINLIIGRNNSGKSALIDLVKYLISPYDLSIYGHKRNIPEVFFTTKLTIENIRSTFDSTISIQALGGSIFDYASMNYLNHDITVKLPFENDSHGRNFVGLDKNNLLPELDPYERQHQFKKTLTRNLGNPLNGRLFRKISAERDIAPEGENSTLQLTANGTGATNIIQTWINQHDKDSTLIEQTFLEKLNEIFEPDSKFKRILVQKIPNGAWEIYLEEENKGFIPLSNSGSGLKTIILVLLNTIVLPELESSDLNRYVFAFEELENNLHPALLRRLLIYITKLQKNTGCCIFLTTHSSVTIDFFGKNEDAQIIHVLNDGSSATARQALEYNDSVDILNDLDVRASDILQSNGIIWVEGPSDKIYIKKWIDIWSGGLLEEGIHYQCLIYGSRLLSHLSAENPDETEGLISVLRANRNAIILMDSDKSNAEEEINDTKNRILAEMAKIHGMGWITAGREIENYLPVEPLRNFFNDNTLAGPKQFTKLPEYLEGKKLIKTADNFDKINFANKISLLLDKANLEKTLDLDEKMKEVCSRIKSWNGLQN